MMTCLHKIMKAKTNMLVELCVGNSELHNLMEQMEQTIYSNLHQVH